MEIYLTKALATLVLPPGGNVTVALIGLIVLLRYRVLGVLLLLCSVVSLYVLSMPIVADKLSERIETISPYPLQSARSSEAGAIVVLGGGLIEYAPEYGGPALGPGSLVRLRYAATLHRKSGLPILVTGGSISEAVDDEAKHMKSVLEEEFGTKVKWIERRSRTTEENAQYSAQILKSEGISTVLLVSHAFHLPRAVRAFERRGINVIPAPTGYFKKGTSRTDPLDYFPDSGSLNESALGLRELLGSVWYRWRYE